MLFIRNPSTLAREVMKAKKRNAVFAFLIFLRLQTSRAIGCGGRIWTNDLRVMSPMSYQTALPRDIKYAHRSHSANIWYSYSKYLSSFLVAYWIFFVDFVQKRAEVYQRVGFALLLPLILLTSVSQKGISHGAAKGNPRQKKNRRMERRFFLFYGVWFGMKSTKAWRGFIVNCEVVGRNVCYHFPKPI